MGKKKISLKSSDLLKIACAIFLPFILTFIVEHFGKIEYVGNENINVEEIRVTGITFTSPFGTKYYQDTTNMNIGYDRQSDGGYKINGSYFQKIPYYFQALYYDIIYPIGLSLVLLLIYFVTKKYSFEFLK